MLHATLRFGPCCAGVDVPRFMAISRAAKKVVTGRSTYLPRADICLAIEESGDMTASSEMEQEHWGEAHSPPIGRLPTAVAINCKPACQKIKRTAAQFVRPTCFVDAQNGQCYHRTCLALQVVNLVGRVVARAGCHRQTPVLSQEGPSSPVGSQGFGAEVSLAKGIKGWLHANAWGVLRIFTWGQMSMRGRPVTQLQLLGGHTQGN